MINSEPAIMAACDEWYGDEPWNVWQFATMDRAIGAALPHLLSNEREECAKDAQIAALREAMCRITTAARKDTNLTKADPLLEFIVAQADAALQCDLRLAISARDYANDMLDKERVRIEALREALTDIAVYGCGMLSQPAAMNGPEETWLKMRIHEYERRARAALEMSGGVL